MTLIRFILLALVFTACTYTRDIPREVRDAQEKHLNQPAQRAPGDDVQLDPIETIPVYPSLRTSSAGNWGYTFLEIDKYEDLIREKATRPVEVFVFDTGGAYDHDGLAHATRGGRTFTREEPIDKNGHSTHVAGTYIGRHPQGNDVGICEVLTEKGLMFVRPYKVLRNSGGGSYGEIANAIREANKVAKELIEQDYFVIYNFSLGGGGSNKYMDRRLKEAEELGVLITMAASGNTYSEGVQYPGNSPHTQGIGAHDRNGRKARFSTTGDEVVFSFPGQGIYSTHLDGTYRELSGTSMATPHAGALAALIASVYPDLSARGVLEHMKKHATDQGAKGRDKEYGYGVPKASSVFSEAPEEPDEPEDDPEEPSEPEPEPKPEPKPKQTHVFEDTQERVILWREMSSSKWNRTPVRYTIRYTHRLGLDAAAQDMRETLDGYFKNRGYILRDGWNARHAVFWAAYFFKMIEGKEKDFDVVHGEYTLHSLRLEHDDFARRPTARRATECNAITFKWGEEGN